jgi:hypothetical protein
VRLRQPFLNVLVNHDGSLNLAKLAPPAKEPVPAKPNSMPRVRIGAFSVSQGRVHFEDRSRDEPFATNLTPIEFDLTDFRTQPNFENKYQFSASTAAGEQFDWSGQFDVQPLSSNGEFSIRALKAATIAAYLEDALPFAVNTGTLDLTGKYQVVSQGGTGPALSLTLPSVKVHTLAIAPKESTPKEAQAGVAPWIQLPELDVDNAVVTLNERSIAVGEISLQRPVLQIWRGKDGGLNLMQLAGAPKTAAPTTIVAESPPPLVPPPQSAAGPPPPPWRVTLAKLSISEADLAVEDRSVNPAMTLHIAPLTLTAHNASSEGTQPLSFDVDTALNESGHLHSAGTVTLAPLVAQLSVQLKDFDLSAAQPYVAQQANMSVYRGRAGADIKIAYVDKPIKGQARLKVTGNAQVGELATRDNVTNTDLVSWNVLEVSGLRYQMAPDALQIEHVRANGLYSRVSIAQNGSINISDALQMPGAPKAAGNAPADAGRTAAHAAPARTAAASKADKGAAPDAGASMPIGIKRVDIEKSTVNFSDHSVQPNFAAGIVNLHGSIVGLSSSPSAKAKVTLDGNVDEFAPVVIRGEINPFAALGYTELTMSFHNMELTTFNPYSGKYAGYSIEQGKLSTDLHYHIEKRKLDATHHIVIDQLVFGAATESKEAVPLPIKLAVAILKDRNGVITLDLPEITGAVDDPKFKIGPLIWTFVLDIFKKVISAPFAAIGSLFGAGPELSYVDFPAGSSTLTDSEGSKLTKLSGALVEKPQLRLDVPLHAISDADNAALAKAALEQAITAAAAAGAPKRSSKTDAAGPAALDEKARLKQLLALYKQKFNAEPEFPGESGGKPDKSDPNATPAAHMAWLEQQLLPQFQPASDQRDVLSKARAQAVQAALLANKELQPERVFLTERESSAVENGQARMELKLE